MEDVSDKVKRFLEIGYGRGSVCGSGFGSGEGSGEGNGDGSGDGCGLGSGLGYGMGNGSGYGRGNVCGSGFGDGRGDGMGCGSGFGSEITMFRGMRVHVIDNVATILTAVCRDYAKGYILNGDMTLTSCYVAKGGNRFAHGNTLEEAVRDLNDKLFEDMDEDERIVAFWECHERGVKYPAADFFEWHHKLTGSCRAGREAFARDHGVNLETDEYTVEEFVEMCKDSYGGNVIRRLMED